MLLSKPKDKSCNQFSSHLTLSLSHKLGLGGLRPLLADQTISSGVPVRSVSLQQLVDPGRVAETRHSADPEEDGDREDQDVLQEVGNGGGTFKILRVRIHLAGQSLHQLWDELLHESLALLGDEANWDEVAGAVEHLPQLLLMEQGWK